MAVVSMKQFLEAGTHFGHQTRRWNPKMRPFIFGAKNGIHIIDLQKTLRQLKRAYGYVRELAERGETVLFVGTKPQAKDIIREEAERCGCYYINERWLGGLMTNFNTIKQSIAKMKRMEEKRGEDGRYEGIIKKEAMRMEKQRIKLERALGGIKEMRRLPGAVFVVDCKKEKIAIQEAQKLGIPIVAVVDTNCDPDGIDHVIPGNDDAIRAIRLFAGTIASAVAEGRAIYEAHQRSAEEEKPRPARGARAAAAAATPPASAASEHLAASVQGMSEAMGAATPVPEPAAEAQPAEPAAEAKVEAPAAEPKPAEPTAEAPAKAEAQPAEPEAKAKAEEPAAEPKPAEPEAPAAEAAEPAAEAKPAEPEAPAAEPEQPAAAEKAQAGE